MVKRKIIVSVPSGTARKEPPERKKKNSLFTPAKEDNSWPTFIVGHLITGIFLGIGTALGTVALRGLIKKHFAEEQDKKDSFLAKGL